VPVAVACVVAAAWRHWYLGTEALFPLATNAALPDKGLMLCVLLGALAGLGSALLTLLVYASEDLFQRLPLHWMWWPALGGVVIGVGGLIEPHALGVGYDSIAALLHADLSSGPALRLLIVKAIIWSVALGSGTSGGVLAPLLIMGGVIGAEFGGFVSPADTGIWALVGMASMMGGTMRAPLTATMFGIELTHDINAMLPIAIGCATAHATTVLLMKRSNRTEKFARRGHHIVREYIVDPFEQMRVSDIMAKSVATLPASQTVEATVDFFTAAGAPRRHKSYPVIDEQGQVIAIVSRTDALRWMREETLADKPLAEQLAGQDVIFGYEDELVGRLADKMAATGNGRIPILRRQDGKLIGLVARRDLLRVRAQQVHHEHAREALIQLRRNGNG
jgi:CIC family chloride channel protein